jgi:hypothetical protein
MSAVHPELPTPGRIVEVRGSIWAVTDVQQQGLPRSSPDETVAELQHAITLQSLGEDNQGDELRVIWELEVGHSVAPTKAFPRPSTASTTRTNSAPSLTPHAGAP